MPIRRRVVARRRPRVMGRGLMDMFNKAKDYLQKNKAVSRLALKLGHPNVARFARSQGYGRRRVVRRAPMRRTGRGISDWFNTAKDFVKNNQLISKGADALGYTNVGRFARSQGYGRKRVAHRRVHHRPMVGGRRHMMHRRVGGRVVFPAVYTTGLGGLSATTA